MHDLISVVVCSYNPRDGYMRRVMAALRPQIFPLEKWELLLVDIASTNLLSATWDLSWHPSARRVREDEQGLSFARRRGILEARGDVVVFVDDNNVVAPDYLSQVEAMMQDTSIGAAGGAAVPVFEENVCPPAHFYTYAGCFACGEQCGPDAISGGLFDLTGPYGVLFGAGLVIRRSDMLDLLDLPHYSLLSDREGTLEITKYATLSR
jgi:glycosyltransferase involved in cell wall biosynthesis